VNRTRILVADGLPIFRTGVRNVLGRESDFHVIEAANLDEIQKMPEADCPDVALIDVELPPDGLVAASWIARERGVQTIVWGFTPTRETVFAAIRAGADGYLHKNISARGLVRALRGLTAGEAPLARDLVTLMIDGLHGMEQRATARQQAELLSAREREVLRLIATGARNKHIALELVISEFTVKRHVQNILQKLDLVSRHAAAAFYRSAFESDGVPEALSQSG
jgi:two-component system nitrate/nitrite response regulator NarL